MSDTRRKIALVCHSNVSIVGEGDDLHLQFSAHRKKKNGGHEFFEISLDVGRYAIRRVVQQVAAMHVRDRERLAKEQRRIEGEIEAIKQPEIKQ